MMIDSLEGYHVFWIPSAMIYVVSVAYVIASG
jgi:hypothetical protein